MRRFNDDLGGDLGLRSMAGERRLGSSRSLLGGGKFPVEPSPPRVLGNFKRGGKVKRSGAYELEKGEKVVPASEGNKSGRASEYRKVYLARRAKKDAKE